MDIVITQEMLLAALAGAATAAGPILVVSGLGATVESMMSLGGSGGFLKKFGAGMAIYGLGGALVGIITVALGAPWWGAFISTAGVMAGLMGGTRLYAKARERRQRNSWR